MKKEVAPQLPQGSDSDDDIDDVELFVERHSSAKEDKPIDYLGMDEAPKKSQQRGRAEPAEE